MDRISDSGSDGCGSIPHGGTKKAIRPDCFFLSVELPLQVGDEDSDYTEYIDYIAVREFEIREILLVLSYEGKRLRFRSIVNYPSQEHSV